MIWRAWHWLSRELQPDSVAIFDIYLHLLNDPGYIAHPQTRSQGTLTAIRRSNLISDRADRAVQRG